MNYNINNMDAFLEACLTSPEGRELDKILAWTIDEEQEALKLISVSIKHCKKNISEIDKILANLENDKLLKSQFLEGLKIQRKTWGEALLVWNLCGFVQMISLETKSIQKGLYSETDEWQRRNIIKQAYVMMYESSDDLLQQTGKQFLDVMSELCPEDKVNRFKLVRKKWSSFRKGHETEFQKVRNNVGAHREHDIIEQINTIEELNWSRTIELLLEYEKLTLEIAPCFSELIPVVVDKISKFHNAHLVRR